MTWPGVKNALPMAGNIYDEVRYSNFPYAQTHPDRLATVAILHGLEPPDPFNARVLEIGCGAGGNLMARAAATPGIRAVGIDLAAAPVADGNAAIAEIGLTNIELRQADVRELTSGALGAFDYIVAHGVYGWIPADARDALLGAIKVALRPEGIAYVSYNTQPGGYFRRMLRDVGLWHARHEEGETAKAEKAQELFKFLLAERATTADTFGKLLLRELPILAEGKIYRLVHDDLAEHWHPLWFAEFAEHCLDHGLGYVGETDMVSLRAEMMPEGTDELLWQLADGDRIAFENYTDLMIARHFRQSVLCHAGRAVDPYPSAERAARLFWAVRPNAEPLEVGLVADAFAVLDRARPRVVGFEELRDVLGVDPLVLGEALIDGFRRERLMPHAGPLRVAEAPGSHPRASSLARWQAARSADLTSLAYTTVHMEEPAARLLITLLDGTRDREAIVRELESRVGVQLSLEDLDRNLVELARLFLLEP
jgi:SAM-dependent methyltransferase